MIGVWRRKNYDDRQSYINKAKRRLKDNVDDEKYNTIMTKRSSGIDKNITNRRQPQKVD